MSRWILVRILASLIAFGGFSAAQDPVRVPLGKPAVIDGKIEPAEWADALQADMAGGGKLFMKSAGGRVYLAIRSAKAGWSHVYLSDGPRRDVYVMHASAALGRSIYKRDGNELWQPANEFKWEVRGREMTAEMRSAMEGYFAKNGWVASNNTMGDPGEVEYELDPPQGRAARLAAVFVSNGADPQFYPVTLSDDALRKELLTGNTPAGLKFDTAKWATLEISSGSAPPRAMGSWEGSVTRAGRRWQVSVNIANESATVDFTDLDVVEVPFPLFVKGNAVKLERPQPSGNPIVFDGRIVGSTFTGKWRGFGVEGVFSLKRTKPKARAYREEEVSFANEGVTLSGTVFIPNGKLRSPAVVLVHGSSPNERTTYRSWGRHFANNGIAALIYDKRGSGRSTGSTRAASMEDLADDALAGVRMLRLRHDIDAGKVGIAGHSQGGWIAPLAAARSGDVAFIIVSGAAAVTPAEQSIYHRAGVMREAGMTETEIAEATRLRERLYLLNRKILAGDGDVEEFRAGISKELTERKDARWFGPAELPSELTGELPPRGALELLFFEAAFVWPKVTVPVLAIWGDRDTVVPVEKSRGMIEGALGKAGNKDLTVKIMPGVDHGNNVVAKGGEWDFPRANEEYDRIIIDWTLKRVM